MDDATRRVLREARRRSLRSRFSDLVCRVHRHDWRRKMYGRLCSRCGIFEADR